MTTFARVDVGRKWKGKRLSFGPRVEHRWQGGDVTRARAGIGASFDFDVSRQASFGLEASYYTQNYPTRAYQNGSFFTLTPTLRTNLGKGLGLSVSLPMIYEATQRPHLDHRDIGAVANISYKWDSGLSVQGRLGYSLNRFLGNYPTLTIPRIDKATTFGVTLSHNKFQFNGFAPTIGLTITENKSNVGLHSFTSRDFTFGFTRRF